MGQAVAEHSARRGTRLRAAAVECAGLGVTVVGAAVVAVPVLRLQDAAWRVPFGYDHHSDHLFYAMTVKTIAEDGDLWRTPALGAPFGLDLRGFPIGVDQLNYLIVRFLTAFSDDWALVMNVFFALTFPLVAAAAAVVLRSLRVSWPMTVTASLLFAFAPYHLLRAESHLYLSAYYAVPLGCWLALEVLQAKSHSSRARLAARAASVVIVASTGIYYAAFTMLLVAGAGLVHGAARRRWRAPALGAAAAAAIAVVVVLNLTPTLLYRRENSPNPEAVSRTVNESQVLGFRLADLLLPVHEHRVAGLSRLRDRYQAPPFSGSPEPAPLGGVAAVGFAGLVVTVVASGLLRGRRPGNAESEVRSDDGDQRLLHLGVVAVIAFFVGVSGGLGTLVAVVVNPALRGWNRVSIFIAFMALAATALIVDRGVDRLADRLPRVRLPTGLIGNRSVAAAMVLAVGLADQVSPTTLRPRHAAAAQRFTADRAFVSAIEGRLPRGAAILQLPYLMFPEGTPVGAMSDYDHLAGYLHSGDLRWSYGAVKGGPFDWARAYAASPATSAAAAAVAGFGGVWVDGAGFADGGAVADAEMRALTGAEPIVGGGGRLRFFDLDRLGDRIDVAAGGSFEDLRVRVLHPIRTNPGAGLHKLEADTSATWRWARPRAEVRVVNPRRVRRRVVVEAWLSTFASGSYIAALEIGGRSEQVAVTPVPVPARFEIDLPPGVSVLAVSTSAPDVRAPNDGRLVALRVANFSIVDADLLTLVAALRTPS